MEALPFRNPRRWNKNSLKWLSKKKRGGGGGEERNHYTQIKYNGQKYSATQTLHDYTKNYRHSEFKKNYFSAIGMKP